MASYTSAWLASDPKTRSKVKARGASPAARSTTCAAAASTATTSAWRSARSRSLSGLQRTATRTHSDDAGRAIGAGPFWGGGEPNRLSGALGSRGAGGKTAVITSSEEKRDKVAAAAQRPPPAGTHAVGHRSRWLLSL